MKVRLYCAVAAMIVLTTQGFAKFGGNPEIPVDRLIANTAAYIKEHPDDAMGPYTLARIHYLALATRASSILGYNQGDALLPSVNGPTAVISPGRQSAWTEDQLRDHLRQAVENYQKALKMDEKNALFHLGLASVSRAALDAGFKLGPIPGAEGSGAAKDGDFTLLWREQAIAEFLRAYELSTGTNTQIAYGHIANGEFSVLVSFEAGRQYVELVTARGVRETERQTLDRVKTFVEALGRTAITGGKITPIVFRLTGAAPLEDLLATKKTVVFDLDGTGRPQRYTWLRPDTGILVWDPSHEERIASGLQLFGSVSFHMFWTDGYRALDALDDNRDGELRGDELKGLAVWLDENQNGISEPGEVIPIERTGIAALSARATTVVGASPANETGLVMADGRVLPTYDWTTEPLNAKPAPPGAVPSS
jgi:hypothetical protein